MTIYVHMNNQRCKERILKSCYMLYVMFVTFAKIYLLHVHRTGFIDPKRTSPLSCSVHPALHTCKLQHKTASKKN
jgi:hypothetical protein